MEEHAQARPPAAPDDRAPARLLGKDELLHALRGLGTLCREYRTLLEHIWDDEAPDAAARALLARHRALAREDDAAFRALAPAGGLLDYVVERLRPVELTFRLPGPTEPIAAPAAPEGPEPPRMARQRVPPPLEALAAQVYAIARTAPTAAEPRVQRVLYPIAALFKAIVRQDWADAELVTTHLNMVTTSRESRELVEQIGRLVRSIHDSLNEIAGDVPLEALSDVTEELPDAVERLDSIITELEAGANRNLDLLEVLSRAVDEGKALVRTASGALEDGDAALEALAGEHPAAADELAAVRDLLARQVTGRLQGFAARQQERHEHYMTLFANQSYQDITGQTLKKVIAFIEGLQYQLIQVISRESGKTAVVIPPHPHAHALDGGADAHDRLSQDKVDAMLAELGF